MGSEEGTSVRKGLEYLLKIDKIHFTEEYDEY